MQETIFRIEWREVARCWSIKRYLPYADAWIIQDTRLTMFGARRYIRRKAGRHAQVVRTVIQSDRTVTLTYRRFM